MIFINLIYDFIKSNKWLVFIYLLVTILDSIIALFAVFTLVPVIQFMTSDESNQIIGSLNYYFDVLSYFSIEFTLVNSLLIFLQLLYLPVV